MKRAAAEQDEERQAKTKAELERKAKAKKEKEDRDYEKYWNRITEKPDASTSKRGSLSKAQMTQKGYYSMTKRMGDKNSLNKMSNLREVYSERGLEEMNFEAVPKRAGEQGSDLPVYLGVGVGIAALAAGSATFSKTGGGTSGEVNAGVVTSDTTKYSSRLIKKDFQLQDLENNAVKALQSPSNLPAFPADILQSLPVLSGSSSFGTGSSVVIFWRPSSILSTRTVSAFNVKFASELKKVGTNVINVLVPKYICEFDLETTESIVGSAFLDGSDSTTVLDKERKLWGKLGISKWPTVLMIDGNRILFALEGTRCFSEVAGRAAMATVLAKNGSANRSNLISAYSPKPMLNYNGGSRPIAGEINLNRPSRVIVDKKTGDLIVSDTGNNRVLIIDKDNSVVKRMIGSAEGKAGSPLSFDRNTYGSDLLNAPMGLAVTIDGVLFIADTGNDLIRRINIREDNSKISIVSISPVDSDSSGYSYDSGEIDDIYRTLGASIRDLAMLPAEEAQDLVNLKGKKLDPQTSFVAQQMIGRSRPLLLPTDLVVVDAFVYVSASGSHQLWRVDPSGFMRPVLGSGLQGKRDVVTTALDSGLWSGGAMGAVSKSSALTDKVRLAQPTGLTALAGGRLMIADSEACCLRQYNLIEGYTSTLSGKSGGKGDERSLQESVSGDSVGGGGGARFQYPSGACTYNNADIALVADTYNHKIKLVKTTGSDCAVSLFFGSGKRGSNLNSGNPLDCQLNSPQGVSYDRINDIVYIADTGNNRIVKYDVKLNAISKLDVKT